MLKIIQVTSWWSISSTQNYRLLVGFNFNSNQFCPFRFMNFVTYQSVLVYDHNSTPTVTTIASEGLIPLWKDSYPFGRNSQSLIDGLRWVSVQSTMSVLELQSIFVKISFLPHILWKFIERILSDFIALVSWVPLHWQQMTLMRQCY